jgi:endo-1,4-beta-xylanase
MKPVMNFQTLFFSETSPIFLTNHRSYLTTGFLLLLMAFFISIPAQEPLLSMADPHDIYIGAAVGSAFWRNEPYYRETLAREYNILVAENEMKFSRIEPDQNSFYWEKTDELIAFAEENNIKVRGHTLVWHNQSGWAENVNANREEMIEILKNHIHQVVGRYKGRVWQWDVVNEGILNNDDFLRNSFWRQKIGDDYIDLAFQFAHEADPDALLFYNDYGAEGMNGKSDKIYNYVKSMLERGIPVHGVGLQCHFQNTGFPADEMDQNIKRLNELGLLVAITELDFRIDMPADNSELELQKENYKDIVRVCLENSNCTSLLTWGFTDKYSWIPNFFNGYGAALPFDQNYMPKPAYNGMWEALDETPVRIIHNKGTTHSGKTPAISTLFNIKGQRYSDTIKRIQLSCFKLTR